MEFSGSKCGVIRGSLVIWSLVGGPVLTSHAGAPFYVPVPTGLHQLDITEENVLTAGKVELGKQLFFDPRLSRDSSTSCASCHDAAKGWSNGSQYGVGVGGRKGSRNVPTLINVAYQDHLFWDGRAQSLEQQVYFPAASKDEMDLSLDEAAARLNKISGYRQQFEEEFGGPATAERIAKCIASFERTIVAANSPFDRFRTGDISALSPSARRGHDVFFFRSNCAFCHNGPNLTDGKFHNTGVGMDLPSPDMGRFAVNENNELERGAFKTPTLRDISRTAPYMHDGSLETLEEVVEFYSRGGRMNPYLDEMISSILMSEQDKADLVVFLTEGLKSDSYSIPDSPRLSE